MIYRAQGAPLKRVSHSISTMEPLQTATFLQRPLSSVPKVVVVESFDCIYFFLSRERKQKSNSSTWCESIWQNSKLVVVSRLDVWLDSPWTVFLARRKKRHSWLLRDSFSTHKDPRLLRTEAQYKLWLGIRLKLYHPCAIFKSKQGRTLARTGQKIHSKWPWHYTEI